MKEIKLQTLRRDFENLKPEEEETIGDYCVKVKSIVNKMTTLREKIEKKVAIKKVLITLTKRYNYVALIVEETKNLSTMN